MSASLKAVVTVEIAQTYCLRSSRQNRAKLRVKLGVLLKAGPRPASSIFHAQPRCRSVDAREFTAGQKNCGKSGQGQRAAGPSGPPVRGAVAGRGPRAAGLLLAKPVKHVGIRRRSCGPSSRSKSRFLYG